MRGRAGRFRNSVAVLFMNRSFFRRRGQTVAAQFLKRVGFGPAVSGECVKKVEAIIQPFKLDEVKAALAAEGVRGITVTEVQGFGRQKGHPDLYRGAEYAIDLRNKIKLEIVVAASQVPTVCKTIEQSVRTGRIGDGKIFISQVDEVVRIRTGERGTEALQ
jgi:nitrogen regulatory protein PII